MWLNATRQTQRFSPHSARRPSPDAYDASVMPPSPPRLAQQFDAGWRGAGVEGVVARADELRERRRQVAICGLGGEEAHAALGRQGGPRGCVEGLEEHGGHHVAT